MLSKEAKSSLMEWEPTSERIMWVRLKAKCQNFTIMKCYAPTDADEEEKDNFYEKLQHTLSNTPNRDIKIVMGDLNAKIGQNNENIVNTRYIGCERDSCKIKRFIAFFFIFWVLIR